MSGVPPIIDYQLSTITNEQGISLNKVSTIANLIVALKSAIKKIVYKKMNEVECAHIKLCKKIAS